MAERDLVAYGRNLLEAEGAFVLKVHGSGMQIQGIPDCLISYPIRSLMDPSKIYGAVFVAIEYKDGTDKHLEPLQDYWTMKIRETGALAAGIHNRGEFDAWFVQIQLHVEELGRAMDQAIWLARGDR